MPRQNRRRAADDKPRRGKAERKQPARSVHRAVAGGGEGGGTIRVGPGETLEGQVLNPGQTIRVEGDDAKVLACKLSGIRPGDIGIYVEKGHRVEIGWNEIDGCAGRGIAVKAVEGVSAPHLHHNYLHGWEGRDGENVHEGIQLGMTASQTDHELGGICEHNLLEGVDVEREAISIKSSDNIVRGNTLRRCGRGSITNRHGRRNRIVGNWIEGSLGIVLLGGPGDCADNEGGEIIAMRGSTTQDGLSKVKRQPGKKPYPSARGWRLARNSGRMRVDGDRQERKFEPEDNRDVGDEIERTEATALNPAEVGPEARTSA